MAKFFLRELHVVVSSAKSWTCTVRLTCELKRDLEWWRIVPSKHKLWSPDLEARGDNIPPRRFEQLRLNDCAEARGLRSTSNTEQYITYKELKAVMCAIKSFLPELKVRRLLLHEDNQYVIGVLMHLTSRSPAMMCELRKLFLLSHRRIRHQDQNDLHHESRRHMGRWAQPYQKQLRLEAERKQGQTAKQTVRPRLHRPFCLLREQANPPVQRQVERRTVTANSLSHNRSTIRYQVTMKK